jgi:hypothetical protein
MDRRTHLPAVPVTPPGGDPGPALAALKEIAEVREGHRGGPLERAVTLWDLVELGLVREEQVA